MKYDGDTSYQPVIENLSSMPPIQLVGNRYVVFEDAKGDGADSDQPQTHQERAWERSTKKDVQRLRTAIEKSARRLPKERTAALAEQAEQIVGGSVAESDQFAATLLEAFSHDPELGAAATYISTVSEKLHNLLVAAEQSDLEKIRAGLEDFNTFVNSKTNRNIRLAQIIGSKEHSALALLHNRLKGDKKTKENIQQLQLNLASACKALSDPAALIATLIESSTNQAADSPQSESLKLLKNSLAQVREYQQITNTFDSIKKAARVSKLSKQELQYLTAVSSAKLLEREICPESWAADFAEGKSPLHTMDAQVVVDALIAPLEKNKRTPANERLKTLNKLLITLLLVVQLMGTQPMWNDMSHELIYISHQIVLELNSVAADVNDFINNPDSTIKTAELPDELVGPVEDAPAEPAEVVGPDAAPEKQSEQVSPELQIPPPIKSDELSWAESTSSTLGVSGSNSVSPEQLRQAMSTIAWSIQKVPEGEKYFRQRLLPIYDSQTGSFLADTAVESTFSQLPISDNITSSKFQISASRSHLDIESYIPAINGYVIDSATIELHKTDGTIENIAFTAGQISDETNVLRLNSDEPFTAKAGETIVVSVGMSPGVQDFYSALLNLDRDKTIESTASLPKELTSLIAEINQRVDLSDLQKLEVLRQWHLNAFRYSVDPKLGAYLTAGNPTPEILLGRVYGTGSIETDPYFDADSSSTFKGICSSLNTYFAMSARLLNLTDGQVMLAGGFLFTDSLPNQELGKLLMGSDAHAWTVYVDRNGKVTNLDATSGKIDELTKKVFESLRKGEQFEPDQVAEANVESDYYSRYPNLLQIPESQTTAASFFENYPVVTDPKAWDIETELGENDGFPTANNFGYPPILMKMDDQMSWFAKSNLFPLDKISDQTMTSEKSGPWEIGRGSYNFRLPAQHIDQQAMWLPNYGGIVPESLNVTWYKKTDSGMEKVATSFEVHLLTNSRMQNGFALVLDLPKDVLERDYFEIAYTSYNSGSYAELILAYDQLSELFSPLVSREAFDAETNSLINFLNRDAPVQDLLGKSGSSNIELLLDRYELTKKLDDGDKSRLVAIYLHEQFEMTFSPRWKELYQTGNPSPAEYFKRMFQHRRLDVQTYTDLLAAILSNIKSVQGDFSIPFNITYSADTEGTSQQLSGVYANSFIEPARPARKFSAKNQPFPEIIILEMQDDDGWGPPHTSGEAVFVQTYWRFSFFNAGEPTSIISSDDPETFKSVAKHYDLISREKAAALLKQMRKQVREYYEKSEKQQLRGPNGEDNLFFDWFQEPHISKTELQKEIIAEYFKIEFMKWLYLRGTAGAISEVLLTALIGFVLGDWVRRRTAHMRGYRKDMIEEILTEAKKRFGDDAETLPLYKDLETFIKEVLLDKQEGSTALLGLAHARRLSTFARGSIQHKGHRPSKESRIPQISPIFGNMRTPLVESLKGQMAYDHRGSSFMAQSILEKLLHEPVAKRLWINRVDEVYSQDLIQLLETQGMTLTIFPRSFWNLVQEACRPQLNRLNENGEFSQKDLAQLPTNVLGKLGSAVDVKVRNEAQNGILRIVSEQLVHTTILPLGKTIAAERQAMKLRQQEEIQKKVASLLKKFGIR